MSDDTARKLGGRPFYEPTQDQRRMVQVLRANGVLIGTIARYLGISAPTVRRHFKVELSHGFEHVKAAMGAALVKAALGGNVGAMCFWLARHGGDQWRDKDKYNKIGFTPPEEEQATSVPLLVLQPVLPNPQNADWHDGPTIEQKLH